MREGKGLALRASDESGTIGLATTHLLRQPAAVFLVYLAVDARHRGRGLGRQLLEHAWSESLARSRDALGMIWEVDGRRHGFHERCGGLALPQPYLQPPVDGSTILPLQLMFRPAHGASPPDAETVRGMIRAMYAEKYHAMNGIPAEQLAALEARCRSG